MTRSGFCGMAALALGLAAAASAGAALTPESARALLDKVNPAVVSVRTQTSTTMAMEGRESDRDEGENESTGCVVNAKGLTAVSLTAIDPSSLYGDLMKKAGGSEGFDMRTEITDIKLQFSDGREVPGQIAVRDRDLDLAFIMPKTPLDAPAQSVDLTAAADAQILDPVLLVWRLGKQNNWATVAQTETIAAVLAKPRKMYMMEKGGMSSQEQLGCLAVAEDGRTLGMQLLRKVPGTGNDRPQILVVILPAKEIAAIARQVESGDIPLEKPAAIAPKPAPAKPAVPAKPKTAPKAPAKPAPKAPAK